MVAIAQDFSLSVPFGYNNDGSEEREILLTIRWHCEVISEMQIVAAFARLYATYKLLLLLQDCTKNAHYKLLLLLQDYTDVTNTICKLLLLLQD